MKTSVGIQESGQFLTSGNVHKIERPQVYQFVNYREFISAFVQYLRSTNNYSIRKFARANGIGSHSYVKMVVDGQRCLTEDSARKIAKGFQMDESESEFFVLLVQWNQAEKPQEQDALYKRMMIFLRLKGRVPIGEGYYQFFSKPSRVALYEALTVQSFGRLSTIEMAKRLKTNVAEVETSLKIFEELQLAKKENGQWLQTGACVETVPEMRSIAARKFHREVLEKAADAVDALPTEERNLQSLTLALSKTQYQEIVDIMTRVLKEANAQYSQNSEAEKIYHLALQIFPVASLANEE